MDYIFCHNSIYSTFYKLHPFKFRGITGRNLREHFTATYNSVTNRLLTVDTLFYSSLMHRSSKEQK